MARADPIYFADRSDAGRQLAAQLIRFKDAHPIILALPRGGVPVGYEIARQLQAPLDIVLVRKIGAPISPELAIGAIVEGTPVERFINREIVADLGIPETYIEEEIARQTREIERRQRRYFEGRSRLAVRNRTAIVVDDGIATGATVHAALRAVRSREPSRLVLAVPVAPASAIASLRGEVDDIVCLSTPEDFGAIGFFYRDFHQLDDDAVMSLLAAAAKELSGSDRSGRRD